MNTVGSLQAGHGAEHLQSGEASGARGCGCLSPPPGMGEASLASALPQWAQGWMSVTGTRMAGTDPGLSGEGVAASIQPLCG